MINILGLSGSLRAASINTALLHAAARLAPNEMSITVFQSLGILPLFNPDHETHKPNIVTNFRAQVAAADALIIASPEYAHGVTGTIKNALDWLVSVESFANKPVAVINTSPRASHADAALREILKTMAAAIVESASINIPLLGAKLDEDSIVATSSVATPIREALAALYLATNLDKTSTEIPW